MAMEIVAAVVSSSCELKLLETKTHYGRPKSLGCGGKKKIKNTVDEPSRSQLPSKDDDAKWKMFSVKCAQFIEM